MWVPNRSVCAAREANHRSSPILRIRFNQGNISRDFFKRSNKRHPDEVAEGDGLDGQVEEMIKQPDQKKLSLSKWSLIAIWCYIKLLHDRSHWSGESPGGEAPMGIIYHQLGIIDGL
jgi:hypothetical protein